MNIKVGDTVQLNEDGLDEFKCTKTANVKSIDKRAVWLDSPIDNGYRWHEVWLELAPIQTNKIGSDTEEHY